MTTPAVPFPDARPQPLLDAVFGSVWPERDVSTRPRLVVASLAVGLLAALVIPFRTPGLGTFLVLAAGTAVVAAADTRLRTPSHLFAVSLSVALLSVVMLRDAPWIGVLCLLAAFGVGSTVLVDARSFAGTVAGAAAIPLAGLRGLPWLARSVTGVHQRSRTLRVLRTATISVLLVVVFGALFASADALFAEWVDALMPDLTASTLMPRAVVLAGVFGVTLAGAYVALNPPAVERLALPEARRLSHRFEWLVPVGFVVAVFATFVGAQLAALFGGHGYVRRTTGLTYADYVHQGFGQLTFATLLTLIVVSGVARKASRDTKTDRVLLRAALGMLCLLTLVVVASALHRLNLYEDAYGFTRLRLLVSVFEGWLGLLVVLVLVAGVRLDGRWLPRTAVVTGAAFLLGLAALNPDGYIAERNVERYQQTGKVDLSYLSGLSADAAPALSRLPEQLRACVLPDRPKGDWLEWNLGRHRAAQLPSTAVRAEPSTCLADPSGR